ncbi:DNA polymerase [Fredinandcohnia quinoae]|uniref:DNA polymerase n=1 Tax=Fredinandcohnia quinoae TaxID=2918902 RepID=A0AAW5DZL1_9BACI|nr:DNA polymerase [Fredinandcohnia sp. SECRCQ15]MCH1625513.1 DNA polymerase [Fredinandcohnia sp. SECRCQ15]
MYHHPYVFNNLGQPITVMYPGYYSNITNQPIMNYRETEYPACYTSYFDNIHRKLPEVDPSLFNESAISMQALLKDASIVLKALADSKPFAKKVMSAAQISDLKEVDRLIKSTGIHSKVHTSFNPDGINLKLSSNIGETECCQLTIALRWL